MSTHARPVATWLAQADDARLAALFADRGVRADANWNDFFDAAEALLEPASVERLLPRLTRGEAVALSAAALGTALTPHDALIDLALMLPDGTVPSPIVTLIESRPITATEPAAALSPASADAAAHAAERAFTSLSILADTLLLAGGNGLGLLMTGVLAAGERRRLVESGIAIESVDDLISIAADAGLVRLEHRRLSVTEAGERWLRDPASPRWCTLVSGFRAGLPRGLRTPAGGWTSPSTWQQEHPWDATWSVRVDTIMRRATLLGLLTDDQSEPTWSVTLREGNEPDASPLAVMMPTEVDRIFLQNDLTAIAPGPLLPALDVRLRVIAERETAAQASTYRFSAASISHAMVLGETEASIIEFLGTLSLTGIPQPLSYLIGQTAQRHGLVRVWSQADPERTRVDSTDQHLIQAMSVDQALRPLGFLREADGLVTRVGRDVVYWALTDSRYPATLIGDDGKPLAATRRAVPAEVVVEPVSYTALIDRLRSHEGPDADAAWLERELEAAVRTKAVLLVSVGMPDGSTRELTLEASGLGGGRLRGRDRAADVERTLPVSSIRSARVVESS